MNAQPLVFSPDVSRLKTAQIHGSKQKKSTRARKIEHASKPLWNNHESDTPVISYFVQPSRQLHSNNNQLTKSNTETKYTSTIMSPQTEINNEYIMNAATTSTPSIITVEGEEQGTTTSIYDACNDGDLELVRRVLQDQQQDSNIYEADGDDWTPLHHAIHGGNVDLIKYLVREKGADLDSITTTEEGQEALHFAITDGHLEV